jgi:hypothetical protein
MDLPDKNRRETEPIPSIQIWCELQESITTFLAILLNISMELNLIGLNKNLLMPKQELRDKRAVILIFFKLQACEQNSLGYPVPRF